MTNLELLEQSFKDDYYYLLCLARKKGVRPCDCSEVVQKTYIAAMGKIDTFEQGRNMRAWLVGFLNFRKLDYYRDTHRWMDRFSSLEDLDDFTEEPPDTLGLKLTLALTKLRTNDLQLLKMSYWERLSEPNIAKTLGITRYEVREGLERAKKRLKKLMEDE